ncbi:MAG: dienelactone hydrolase family protein [Candidatus Omnitrophica bacterium]|nr:dienelactone hydrolase family protein [Candidatus Omnitrophota bacterium]
MKKIVCIILLISIFISYFAFNRNGANVIEEINLSYNFEERLSDYLQFPTQHRQYKSEITEKKIVEQMKNAIEKADEWEMGTVSDVATVELKKIILHELNIGFLLNNIDKEKLIVITVAEVNHDRYFERELIFKDVHVGEFHVRLLIPKQQSRPLPAIVGLHGHNESNVDFRDKYRGKDLVQAGFVVIMPSFRAAQVEWPENTDDNRISRELFLNGFTLLGLRCYEVLLLVKYLKYMNEVDNKKIGIIGHSMGSVIAILVSRMSSDIKAITRDCLCEFINVVGLEVASLGKNSYIDSLHCETVLSLSHYTTAINDEKTLSIPVLTVPYGFNSKKDRQAIGEFFLKFLKFDNRFYK